MNKTIFNAHALKFMIIVFTLLIPQIAFSAKPGIDLNEKADGAASRRLGIVNSV